ARTSWEVQPMLSGFAFVLFATLAQQAPCEALKTLTLPHTTITTAEFVPPGAPAQTRGGRGGGGTVPAHCRVAAVLAPSSDSHIEMELWMPAEGWNGKFLAVGNGGWARNIEHPDPLGALARDY